MMILTRDKRQTVIKQYVKVTVFHIIKFINNESELHWQFPIFAVKIMDHLAIPKEKREVWWENNKKDARKAMHERRSSITGAMKATAQGKNNDKNEK
jgi:hypothetical protein